MLEPIKIELYKKERDWEECWIEDSKIIEYFDEETNNFIHWAKNRDKIYYWYNNLPQGEKKFIKEIIFREVKNGKNDLMAKEPGWASLSEGIYLKEGLPKTCMNQDEFFLMQYKHNHNYRDYREAWVGLREDDWGLHKDYIDFGKDGTFDFFVSCDPEFLEYIYNNNEFDCYVKKNFCDEKDNNRFFYSINNDIEFLNWLKKKKEDFDYAVRLKKFLEEINHNLKLIEFIRSDNDFNNYEMNYLTDDINKSKEFFNWLLCKKQIFDLTVIRLDKFNESEEVDMEFLRLIIDSNFQALKESLLNLKKFYPNLFRRWIFNWKKFRFERNPLCDPSLGNIDDIFDKLTFLDDSAIFNPINKITAAKKYLTLITNQNSNINIQEIDKFILNSNLFSKPIIIYKDNEVIFYNIKDDGTIESFSFVGKSAKLFKKYKEIILQYFEESIKERNFIPFLSSLQTKLVSIKWWQNKEQEIDNFLPDCYSYLRYSLIKKYKFVNLFPGDEISAKNASNFYVFLDKNIDKNFSEIYICLKKLKRIHPEYFRNPFNILNRVLSINNIDDLDNYFSKNFFYFNDNISAKLLYKITICINYIRQNIFYFKRMSCNNLNNHNLKNLLKSVLPENIVDKLNEVNDKLFLKFNIKENEIDYFQFAMNFAYLKEFEQCNFVNYFEMINCIEKFDKEYILALFNSKSPEKFKISFNDFSTKVKNSYNNYFKENYEKINIKNSNCLNQICDMKNFIEQVNALNSLDNDFKENLNVNANEIKEISSQISSTENYFTNLSNELSQARNTFKDLSYMQKEIEENENKLQDVLCKTKNLQKQIQGNYSLIKVNVENLLKQINESKQELEKIKNELNDNEKQKKEIEQAIEYYQYTFDNLDSQVNVNKQVLAPINEEVSKNAKKCNRKKLILNFVGSINWPRFLSKPINSIKNNSNEQLSTQQELQTKAVNLTFDQNSLDDGLETTKKILYSLQKKFNEISSEIENLLERKNKFENKIKDYTSKYDQFKNFMKSKEFSFLSSLANVTPLLDDNSNLREAVLITK